MSRCILLVDDNAVIRHMLRTAFEERSDWEVGEAQNGRDAIDKARESKPDLIVLDLGALAPHKQPDIAVRCPLGGSVHAA